jgi:RimJ/RimL family protein N-acetyltransferase
MEKNFFLQKIKKKQLNIIADMRNSQLNILRNRSAIKYSKQFDYFSRYVWTEYKKKKPKQLLFSIFYNKYFLGYGGLTNFDWTNLNAEVSFLLEKEISKNNSLYKKIFSNFLKEISVIAFKKFKLVKIYTETFGFRKFHISILKKNNFILEGVKKKHIVINNRLIDLILHARFKK